MSVKDLMIVIEMLSVTTSMAPTTAPVSLGTVAMEETALVWMVTFYCLKTMSFLKLWEKELCWCATMIHMALSVMTVGINMMQLFFVDSLEMIGQVI